MSLSYESRRADSSDGSAVLRIDYFMADGRAVEAIGLRLPGRNPEFVLCMPSQIGCRQGCRFCGLRDSSKATNLSLDILIQMINKSHDLMEHSFGVSIHGPWQISFMGQGEPLLNWDVVCETMQWSLMRWDGICFGLSTIAIMDQLSRLSDCATEIAKRLRLQISLHASDSKTRAWLMPATSCSSIESVLLHCSDIAMRTSNRVCLNYLLIDGVNDRIEDAQKLASMVNPELFYIKLSSLNYTPGNMFRKSSRSAFSAFYGELLNSRIKVHEFNSIGTDLHAGCGQVGWRDYEADGLNIVCHSKQASMLAANVV